MHPSALLNSEMFFKTYAKYFSSERGSIKVVEIGSLNVNGSIRDKCPDDFEYIGLDFVKGNGVDIVLEDPYCLPLESDSIDILVTSSCFEHSEMFWLVFLEGIRIVKSNGLIFLTAPSNGMRHCYPVDCWRFYPDSGKALAAWANRHGFNVKLLESYTSEQDVTVELSGQWNDFVAVFAKDALYSNIFKDRILDGFNKYLNGWRSDLNDIQNPSDFGEDQRKFMMIASIINNEQRSLTVLEKSHSMTIEQHKLYVILKILTNEIRFDID